MLTVFVFPYGKNLKAFAFAQFCVIFRNDFGKFCLTSIDRNVSINIHIDRDNTLVKIGDTRTLIFLVFFCKKQ